MVSHDKARLLCYTNRKKTEKIKNYRKYKYNISLAYVPYSMCVRRSGPHAFQRCYREIRSTPLSPQKMYAAAAESSCSNWLLFPFLLWIIPVEYFQSIGKRKNVKPINTQAGIRNGKKNKSVVKLDSSSFFFLCVCLFVWFKWWEVENPTTKPSSSVVLGAISTMGVKKKKKEKRTKHYS